MTGSGGGGAPTLIVTADDFGADLAVNRAVEDAHLRGVLTCASLMVAGDAADDAVARAKRLPRLGVGLHVVLVEGRPMLPPERVPDLVDASGRFRTNMVAAGVRFFFRPAVRRQLRAEIAAQFEAFAATGFALDHVNAHKHFHLHPTVAGLILEIGRAHGMRAARAPVEPVALLRTIEPVRRTLADRVAAPYARAVAGRFRRAGVAVPDRVLGLAWTGAMTAQRIAGLVRRLPTGVSELYLHPADADEWPGHAARARYRDEHAALVDGNVARAVAERGAVLARFADVEHGKDTA